MKCLVLGATLLTLAAAVYGQSVDVTENIPLRFLDARMVPTTIKTSSGLHLLTLNIADNSLTVRGTHKAVTAFKTDLRAADVQKVNYCLKMRLVRFQADAAGHVEETVAAKPTVMTLDKMTATIAVTQETGGYAVEVTPRHDSEGTVMLTAEVRELGEQGEVVRSGRNEYRATLGKTARVTGMTDATDKDLRRATLKGQVVRDKGAYTGYYLEVEPTISK